MEIENIKIIDGINDNNKNDIVKWTNEKGKDFLEQWAGASLDFPLTESQIDDLKDIYSIFCENEFVGIIQKIRKEMSEINNAQNKKWTDALQAALNKNGGSIDLSRIPVEDAFAWLQSRSNELTPIATQEAHAEESSGGTSEEIPSTEDMETTPQENAYESENTMQ